MRTAGTLALTVSRAATVLLMMVLTTTAAWAAKPHVNIPYVQLNVSETTVNNYESRFKLVFSASADADNDSEAPFAFVDASGNIIITGVGVGDACNASLQVVDIMGRVLVCRDALNASLSPSLSLSTAGMTPGVYVLRLINGEDVRTQKMVVK